MQIYKTTNDLTGQFYIGYDTKNRPKYLGSGTYFNRALKKYGHENFTKVILEDNIEDFEELKKAEIFWIAKLDAMNPKIGYNLCVGGNGCVGYKHTDDAKKAISESNKNKPKSFEHKKKLSESQKCEKSYWYGKNRGNEFKKNLSILLKNRKFSEESKKKMSDSKKDKKKSVIQYDKEMNFITEYESIHEANKKTNIWRNGISNVCRGKAKIAGGFIWKFKK